MILPIDMFPQIIDEIQFLDLYLPFCENCYVYSITLFLLHHKPLCGGLGYIVLAQRGGQESF
jgi:hypothetical protein